MDHETFFEDDFEDGLRQGWSWVREMPDAWQVTEGVLRLRTLPGTLWGDRNDACNLLLRPKEMAVRGLTAEVSVYNQPLVQGEQAGLIWYADDANYIKLVKESLEGRIWIVLAREEDDEPALVERVPIVADTARLRLTLDDAGVAAAYLVPESETWQPVGTCAPLPHGMLQPGIFTHGGPADVERWSEFSLFTLLVKMA